MKITYTQDLEDKDGNVFEEGILLFLEGRGVIIKVGSVDEIKEMIHWLEMVVEQVSRI